MSSKKIFTLPMQYLARELTTIKKKYVSLFTKIFTNIKPSKCKKSISRIFYPPPPAVSFDVLKYRESVLKSTISNDHEYNSNYEVTFAKKSTTIGYRIICITLLLFGLWAGIAKIESAIVVSGSVRPLNNIKKIQHLDGGEIKEILVKEGDFVEKEQVILILDDTSALSNTGILEYEKVSLLVKEQRLKAEKYEEAQFNISITEEIDKEYVNEIISNERKIFNANTKIISGNRHLIHSKIEQLQSEMNGVLASNDANYKQLKLLNDEYEAVNSLYKRGNATKTRLFNILRKKNDLEGKITKAQSAVKNLEQQVISAQLEFENINTDYFGNIIKELRTVGEEILIVNKKILVTQNSLRRTIVKAPQSGIINSLKYYTAGAIIAPGEVIMEIIPDDGEMVAEVSVNPSDIDNVYPGLPTKIRFTAYDSRSMPIINGQISNVSANKIKDEQTHNDYYMATIRIKKEEMEKIKKIKLYTGMPVDSIIITGSRTFFSYLTEPITKNFFKSFR